MPYGTEGIAQRLYQGRTLSRGCRRIHKRGGLRLEKAVAENVIAPWCTEIDDFSAQLPIRALEGRTVGACHLQREARGDERRSKRCAGGAVIGLVQRCDGDTQRSE